MNRARPLQLLWADELSARVRQMPGAVTRRYGSSRLQVPEMLAIESETKDSERPEPGCQPMSKNAVAPAVRGRTARAGPSERVGALVGRAPGNSMRRSWEAAMVFR